MIYFDNAATSRRKPEEVYNALNYYISEIGVSPGRGSYSLAIQASRMLYQSRKQVAAFFNIDDPSNVVFTKNSTEAINLFFNGFLEKNDHVIISPYEHNAVLRPLQNLKEKNIIDYTVLNEEILYDNPEKIVDYIRPNTRLLVLTLASNLTGQIVFNRELARICSQKGIGVFVDSSQGAGKKIIDCKRDYIDYIAFTGHKDLFSLPGVGGLVSKNELIIKPLIQGGTGIHGESYTNPDVYPDSYESGTLNMPAIWSLKSSMAYIEKNHNDLVTKERYLTDYFISKLSVLNGIIIYNKEKLRVSTFCFNIEGVSSSEVVRLLDKKNICVRGGIHCAILAHETIGTVNIGAVRVSLNYFNELSEIDYFIDTIKEIIKCI